MDEKIPSAVGISMSYLFPVFVMPSFLPVTLSIAMPRLCPNVG